MTTTLNASTAGAGGFIATGDNSGSLALQTAGTTAVTLDASQNATFAGSVKTNTLTSAASTALTLQSAGTTALTINTSQYVGIGTTSPASGLDIRPGITGNFNAITMGYGRSANPTDAVHKISWSSDSLNIEADTANTIASNIIFTNDNTERMRIDSSGNLLVGATAVSSQGEKFTAISANLASLFKTTGGATNNWATNFWNNGTSGNNLFVEFGTETAYSGRGSITYNRAGGLTVYNTTSDARLKQNIVDSPSALSKINSVQIRSFDWKETGNHVDFGVIAQELKEVAPEAVTEGEDNEDNTVKRYWGVDTSALVPALVKALQELKAINDTQAEIINALTARVVALESK